MTTSPLLVLERAVQLHQLLDHADIDHAIGGALALAYHVAEARATRDIDLNIHLAPAAAMDLLSVLPVDVLWGSREAAAIRRDGQVRLLWPHPEGDPPIPLDLFFADSDFHEVVHRRAVRVAMLADVVPILSATDLMVFKALYDRRKDWADIEELLRHGSPDVGEAREWIVRVVGPDDRRLHTLDALIAELRGG